MDYAIGSRVQCQASFDGLGHPAEVLNKRLDETGTMLYYIHFMDCDKRMDGWVTADRINPPGLTPAVLSPGLESMPSLNVGGGDVLTPIAVAEAHKLTRRLKRKIEESNAVHAGVDDHATAHDHAHEKDAHGDKHKVKNIEVRAA